MNLIDKVPFYRFLNGDTSISDFEKLVYANRIWEQQLGEDLYFELINFDFGDKNSSMRIREFILTNIVERGEFETWKLKSMLEVFLNDVQNMHLYLKKFYNLYCGTYQENGERIFRFQFLANLGLNYFVCYDEDYLEQFYGDKWKLEYDKIKDNFKFYHKQLKPYAEIIIEALKSGEILINNDGTYSISSNLQKELESDKIIPLEHPERKNTG